MLVFEAVSVLKPGINMPAPASPARRLHSLRALPFAFLILLLPPAACVQPDREARDGTDESVGDPARGLALLNAFPDSLPGYSGNGLTCTSCHLDNGTRKTALPWLGSAARYPRYRPRSGTEESMQTRVNDCIERSLAGRSLPGDGQEMRDIVAYMEELANEPRPADAEPLTVAGDPEEGREGYALQCARCHGGSGEGINGLGPAVWGIDSYSIGAGMARQYTLATFVRRNMPNDLPGSLGDREAASIAAYVLTMPRQDYPPRNRDWPNADPPADVAYPTDAAKAAGLAVPALRPVLARRIPTDPPPP